MNEPPIDLEKAHRWFAIQWNNAAWDALEADGLDEEAQLAALHRGHASVAHWREVGNKVNWVRGLCLLANIEAAFGSSSSAVRLSELCLTKADGLEGLEDWDHAFNADAAARAAAAALDEESQRAVPDPARVEALRAQAGAHRQNAQQLGQAIVDEEDRKFFQQWHSR